MPSRSTAHYEQRDVAPRLVGWLAIGIAAFLLLTPLILMALYPGALRQRSPQLPGTAFPAPRLQVENAGELAALRRANDERLASFGWIDRPRGVVHLPIGRAMSLTVQRGLPEWPKP
jgi:hypothetical protein